MIFETLEGADTFSLAGSYKLAGDMLADVDLSSCEAFELLYPVLFNYRHAIELYMKAIIGKTNIGHDLKNLLEKLRLILKTEFDASIPDWFEKAILEFDAFDPGSTAFRYGGLTLKEDERWVDLPHIKKKMRWIAESFQRIRLRRWS